MTIRKTDIKDIKPALEEKNWKIISSDKASIINGELYTHMLRSHWFFPTIKKSKQYTTLGFYTDTEHPKELVRVAGTPPDLWVITYAKSTASEIGKFGGKTAGGWTKFPKWGEVIKDVVKTYKEINAQPNASQKSPKSVSNKIKTLPGENPIKRY